MSKVIDLANWKKLKSSIKLTSLGDDPPRELLIFPLGRLITTLKGDFILTEEGAREVMAKYVAHGTDLHFDYEHLSIEPEKNASPDLAIAAGWFDLELRPDGLWATNIEWTPRAEKMIRAKEYRYISPAFHADERGEIHDLLNIALTNLPATDNLDALVAASMRARKIDNRDEIGKSRRVRLSLTREKQMTAHPLAKHLKGLDHGEVGKETGISSERMTHLAAGHPPTTEEMSACLKHLALPEEESKKLTEEHGEYLKGMDAPDHKDKGEDDEDKGEDDEEDDDAPEKNSLNNRGASDGQVPHENKSAGGEAKVKGNKDEADEDEGDNTAPAKASKTSRTADGALTRDELIALTGSTDPKEQRRKLTAMASNSKQVDSDREFLKQMRAESEGREKGELVALAKAQNRWTPNWEKFFSTKPNSLLREMLTSGAMPQVGGEELQPLMASGVDGITLLRSENRYITMCRVHGVSDDPKEYAKVKADIISLRDNAVDGDGYPVGRRGLQLGPTMTKRLMDSWMGIKPGKTSSNRFTTRQQLRSTAKADPVGV